MKKTSDSKTIQTTGDDLLPDYRFDYSQARPNRFAGRSNGLVVMLDADVAQVFTTPESVNGVLRALISTMPKTAKRKTKPKST
jgi:hypothetical protein